MKSVAVFFLTVVMVAAGSSWVTLRWANRSASEGDTHEWLHRELDLTPAQHEALQPIEERFAVRQRELTQGLRDADRDLALAIAEDKAYTPRVAAAVVTVHHRMGDLQKASIEHVFEMRSVLTPKQGEKLLRLAEEGLEANP